ncbi:MAG: type II toxin-antitoxin system VapC family toxin [Proteobacteria bacterium]|nr:type II toxin-antitoxin system VapC family toxin [Pseudomonadota bacterium]
MSLVLDSSVALTWCFEDERTNATIEVLGAVEQNAGIAPSLWPLEVQNALVMAERRKRLSESQRHQLSNFLSALPVALDNETAEQAWTVTTHLAERFRLTLYDAAYLELAHRTGLPLATLDLELRNAGSALGVPLLGVTA